MQFPQVLAKDNLDYIRPRALLHRSTLFPGCYFNSQAFVTLMPLRAGAPGPTSWDLMYHNAKNTRCLDH